MTMQGSRRSSSCRVGEGRAASHNEESSRATVMGTQITNSKQSRGLQHEGGAVVLQLAAAFRIWARVSSTKVIDRGGKEGGRHLACVWANLAEVRKARRRASSTYVGRGRDGRHQTDDMMAAHVAATRRTGPSRRCILQVLAVSLQLTIMPCCNGCRRTHTFEPSRSTSPHATNSRQRPPSTTPGALPSCPLKSIFLLT